MGQARFKLNTVCREVSSVGARGRGGICRFRSGTGTWLQRYISECMKPSKGRQASNEST